MNRQYSRFGAHINSCTIRIAPMPNTLPENFSIIALNEYKKRRKTKSESEMGLGKKSEKN